LNLVVKALVKAMEHLISLGMPTNNTQHWNRILTAIGLLVNLRLAKLNF
jgi:hypothetical protein